jgi:hypothetical protein
MCTQVGITPAGDSGQTPYAWCVTGCGHVGTGWTLHMHTMLSRDVPIKGEFADTARCSRHRGSQCRNFCLQQRGSAANNIKGKRSVISSAWGCLSLLVDTRYAAEGSHERAPRNTCDVGVCSCTARARLPSKRSCSMATRAPVPFQAKEELLIVCSVNSRLFETLQSFSAVWRQNNALTADNRSSRQPFQ